MDFTFRAFCHRNANSSTGSQSSSYTYLTQQAFQCDLESCNGGRYNHFIGNRDINMERQLEKERIRGEILAEEAARRHELEEEVRRELREERELELRRRGSDQWEAYQSACYVEQRSLEKRIALPSQERMSDYPRLEEWKMGGYEEELPFQRAPQAIKSEVEVVEERKMGGYEEELPFQRAPQAIKTEEDVFKEEEKKQLIFLAKPEANHSGKKRKATASPLEVPSEVANKVMKEWSCALCQISATSKLGLEEHLKGKKHKSKQAGQKVGMIGLCTEKISNPLGINQVGESDVGLGKSQQTSSKNETNVENDKIGNVKNIEYGGAVQMMPKKMRFKYFCELCEVGAICEEVMNDHKKGKKHLRRLHRLGAKNEAIIGTQMVEKN